MSEFVEFVASTRTELARLQEESLELKSSLEAVCNYVDQQLAPLKEANAQRIQAASALQVRITCLQMAIGVSANPQCGKPIAEDIARTARVFENFMDGQTPPAAPVVSLVKS